MELPLITKEVKDGKMIPAKARNSMIYSLL